MGDNNQTPRSTQQSHRSLRIPPSVFICEKPSFLRYIARKCNDLSRTCRNLMEQTSITESFINPSPLIDKKYANDVYEAIFSEGISDRGNAPRNPREMLATHISVTDFDISAMEYYRKSSPFVVITQHRTCIVCGRQICHDRTCLAPYGCKGCTQRVYCSPQCFGIDWPFHVKFCEPGQADFLLQFLFNRLKHKKNLKAQLQNMAYQGTHTLGRGAIVIIFEQIEALKIFLKYNQDFSLEYYYSLQYLSLYTFQDKFFWLEEFNLIISLIKSYNICDQITIVVIVKNSLSSIAEWSLSQPYTDVVIFPIDCREQKTLKKDDEIISNPNYVYFDTLLSTTKWDFKKRRRVCLCLQRLYFTLGHQNVHQDDFLDVLNRYYLTGILKIENIENYIYHKKFNHDEDYQASLSTRTSIV
ncbi:hypothetical protein HZS_8148 [Henneguya salminicola]|nr:hypothetical protein HZS_8148 [Henneguya salminicola]